MELKLLLKDDAAVSTVIGVVLMVAVTVILASVIAVFVFGLSETEEQAPTTTFTFAYSDSTEKIDILVGDGDQFDAAQVTLEGSGFGANESGRSWADIAGSNPGTSSTTQISAGDSITLTQVQSDYLVEIAWRSRDGDTSAVLGARSGPARR